MIKRQYFISTAVNTDIGRREIWEQFYHKSWFADPVSAFSIATDRIAKRSETIPSKLTIIAFNRC